MLNLKLIIPIENHGLRIITKNFKMVASSATTSLNN
jgi:hypothetical protein